MRNWKILTVILLAGFAGNVMAGDWVNLFDGKTLSGWSVHSGTAKYETKDGTIIGTTVIGSPNTFLCTDKEYDDFIMEFEVLVDEGLNSGVQVRSQAAQSEMIFWSVRTRDEKPSKKVLEKDCVYGYQVEIPDNAQGRAGHVYDEARRRIFLGPEPDPSQKPAFKMNQWNTYRIQCQGDLIQTWVNGVACADFRDSMDARGFIGLQVHGVGKKNYKPLQVRWRNIRLQELD
jgi:hypothetical protein